jgi:hypothetical protein
MTQIDIWRNAAPIDAIAMLAAAEEVPATATRQVGTGFFLRTPTVLLVW